jgi:hypothetical protein
MTRIRPSSRARAARRASRHCDRTARSALSSCSHGTRKTAITASPMNFSTLPPCSSRIAGHVATMATLGVRSRSLAGEWRSRNPLNEAVQRTTANGRERLLTVAMQKVEGSSPFIRFTEPAGNGVFFRGIRTLGPSVRGFGQVLVRFHPPFAALAARSSTSATMVCSSLGSRGLE